MRCFSNDFDDGIVGFLASPVPIPLLLPKSRQAPEFGGLP